MTDREAELQREIDDLKKRIAVLEQRLREAPVQPRGWYETR